MSLFVIPLIVLVSPSLCLHSRSRLSASSSSSSWRPLEDQAQDPLLCCWAPGPQPLQARPREAWSSKASSELAVVLTRWSVSHRCFQVKIYAQLCFNSQGGRNTTVSYSSRSTVFFHLPEYYLCTVKCPGVQISCSHSFKLLVCFS